MTTSTRIRGLAVLAAAGLAWAPTAADPEPGEGPALEPVRVTQAEIENDERSLEEIRVDGLKMFTTLFNRWDGYGDGPLDPVDTTAPGGRPTLQGNGTLLRVNGLDAQGCIECHATLSASTVPPRLGIGGVGGSNTNAIIMPTSIDVADSDLDGAAGFDGRFANPPFLFGVGGVELLALEMTEDLQALKQQALDNPGTPIALVSKDVEFGTIVADTLGNLDTSQVVGVSPDLIVRPFGRKGEFATTREFDIGAMRFHFGMEPVEAVGPDVDGDGDGVTNEITVGDLSSLGVFLATLERPFTRPLTSDGVRGLRTFRDIGCAECHVPTLRTRDRHLPLRFPEVPTDPRANVYYEIDLTEAPASFERSGPGIRVPLFADLKRHDMGPDLAETFAGVDEQTNREFTTARLWGVADTAPYLHDGRATTLTQAILLHGGEAEAARDAFAALSGTARMRVLEFLRSLRTPEDPARDLLELLDEDDDDDHDSADRNPDRDDDDDDTGSGLGDLTDR